MTEQEYKTFLDNVILFLRKIKFLTHNKRGNYYYTINTLSKDEYYLYFFGPRLEYRKYLGYNKGVDLISFEEVFEVLPLEVKMNVLFHLDLFKNMK